jgi:hypothetical protein
VTCRGSTRDPAANRPLQLKICKAAPVPSMNQAPAAAPVGEMTLPGAAKNIRAITSKAAARAWRSQSVEPAEADGYTICLHR